jgi:hypothetical protein
VWQFSLALLLFMMSSAPAQESTPGKAFVARRWANVRVGASTSSNVLRRVYEGEEFDVLEVKGEWIRIRVDEHNSGWVFHDLVRLQGPTAAPEGESILGDEPIPSSRDWVYAPILLLCGVSGTAGVYWYLSRNQRLFDYAGRLDRMTSSAYIDSVGRDDVVRLTKAFGIGDRAARSIARQTYLDRYRASSSHQKLTEKEKASFRKLQTVLSLGDEDVMRIMARVYKTKRRGERPEA